MTYYKDLGSHLFCDVGRRYFATFKWVQNKIFCPCISYWLIPNLRNFRRGYAYSLWVFIWGPQHLDGRKSKIYHHQHMLLNIPLQYYTSPREASLTTTGCVLGIFSKGVHRFFAIVKGGPQILHNFQRGSADKLYQSWQSLVIFWWNISKIYITIGKFNIVKLKWL